MKTDMFRKLDMNDENLKFEYSINKFSDLKCKVMISDSLANPTGNSRITEKTSIELTLYNKSENDLFFNIIDIEPTNKINWITTNDKNYRNYLLSNNKSIKFCIKILKPYGVEQMKIIATDRSVDFSSLSENGSSLSRGSNSNSLMNFVDKAVNGSRGGEGVDVTGATVKTLTFEIMEKN
jgi:hypothetical protein